MKGILQKEPTEGTELSRVEQVCRYRSIKMIRSHPTKSNQIKPNQTRKSELRWRVQRGTPGSHREHRWCDVLDGTAERRFVRGRRRVEKSAEIRSNGAITNGP